VPPTPSDLRKAASIERRARGSSGEEITGIGADLAGFALHSPTAAVLRSSSGEHLWVNNTFLAVHGCTWPALVGKPLSSVMPVEVAEAHQRVDEQVLDTGAPVRWRLPIARIEAAGQASEATGISFPVTLHGGDTAVGSSYVDQTEITASRRRLTELNKLYDGLFERSNIPIAIYGTDHRLRDANPAYCRLLRYERHNIVGKDIRELVTPGTTAMYASQWVSVVTGRSNGYNCLTSGVRSDGSIITGQTIVSLVRDDDGDPQMIYAVSDPTLLREGASPSNARVGEAGELTEQELTILEGIAEGLSSQALASRLSISTKGVEYHVQKLLRAFRARSRPALVGRAYAVGALTAGYWPPRAAARTAESIGHATPDREPGTGQTRRRSVGASRGIDQRDE